MKREKKQDKILHELYRRAFDKSTPRGDFDELLEKSEVDEWGRKLIPYMDYECEEEVLSDVFESVMKEFKVPKKEIPSYRFSFYLGCSPKTKTK